MFLRTLILEILLNESILKEKISHPLKRKQNFELSNKNPQGNRLEDPKFLPSVPSKEIQGPNHIAHVHTLAVLPVAIQP